MAVLTSSAKRKSEATGATRPVAVEDAAARAAVADMVRQELARELHDSVTRSLTQLLVEMEEFKVGQFGRTSVITSVDLFQAETREVLNELRAILYRLRGEAAELANLRAEVTRLAAAHEERTGMRTCLNYAGGWPEQVRLASALHLLRIAGEALANAHRHSGSRTADITLDTAADGRLSLTIRDNGLGFSATDPPPGLGITGMRERALLLGGELRVETVPGSGAAIRLLIRREALQ